MRRYVPHRFKLITATLCLSNERSLHKARYMHSPWGYVPYGEYNAKIA
jgi:hypothetical protein